MADLADHELLALGHGFGELAAMEDILVLDVGAGISPQNVLTMLSAEYIVLVTEAEIAALTDAYAVIKCVAQLRENADFSVIVNRVAKPGQGDRTYDKLAEVTKRYAGARLRYLGEILHDPTVTQRRLGQLPLAVSDAKGTTMTALRQILGQLERATDGFEPRRVEGGRGLEERFREHRVFLC